jgi:hypothetical protein
MPISQNALANTQHHGPVPPQKDFKSCFFFGGEEMAQ